MKNFKDYLAESERTYNYRIKMVGDLPSEFYNSLKGKLSQFDPLKIGSIKTTPIQAKPADFPAFENEKVTSFDVKFRYPAIEPQIKQLAQIIGLDPNKIGVSPMFYKMLNWLNKSFRSQLLPSSKIKMRISTSFTVRRTPFFQAPPLETQSIANCLQSKFIMSFAEWHSRRRVRNYNQTKPSL